MTTHKAIREALEADEYLTATVAKQDLRALLADLDAKTAELETERLRLAACGVVAMANTPESAKKAREMSPEYWSGSAQEVASAVDREMAMRDELQALRREPMTDEQAEELYLQVLKDYMEDRIDRLEIELIRKVESHHHITQKEQGK